MWKGVGRVLCISAEIWKPLNWNKLRNSTPARPPLDMQHAVLSSTADNFLEKQHVFSLSFSNACLNFSTWNVSLSVLLLQFRAPKFEGEERHERKVRNVVADGEWSEGRNGSDSRTSFLSFQLFPRVPEYF